MIPLLILIALFSLLYFRKENLLRPNAAIMQEYVNKKAEFAKRTGNNNQINAFNALINNDLNTVLILLKNNFKEIGSQYLNNDKSAFLILYTNI